MKYSYNLQGNQVSLQIRLLYQRISNLLANRHQKPTPRFPLNPNPHTRSFLLSTHHQLPNASIHRSPLNFETTASPPPKLSQSQSKNQFKQSHSSLLHFSQQTTPIHHKRASSHHINSSLQDKDPRITETPAESSERKEGISHSRGARRISLMQFRRKLAERRASRAGPIARFAVNGEYGGRRALKAAG